MKKHNLVSKYTKLKYRNHSSSVNNEKIANIINGQFNKGKQNEVIVSDLTYVKVGGKWHYICLLVDLFNTEVIGYSIDAKKDKNLVHKAFLKSTRCLKDIEIFHSDGGNKFKNKIINEMLSVFNITRSLSRKGNPYDNAAAKATYKIFKTEFINWEKFNTLDVI